MVLDIRGDVFVVRICARQRGIVGVRLGIVPIQLLFMLPDFVAITVNPPGRFGKGKPLSDDQPYSFPKLKLPTENRNGRSSSDHHQC